MDIMKIFVGCTLMNSASKEKEENGHSYGYRQQEGTFRKWKVYLRENICQRS